MADGAVHAASASDEDRQITKVASRWSGDADGADGARPRAGEGRRVPLGQRRAKSGFRAESGVKRKTTVVAAASQVHDIDADTGGYPALLMVPQYAQMIYEYYRAIEPRYRVAPDYLRPMGSGVTERMRAVLVDWLVDVHAKLRLMPETLHLAVNVLDRYLSIVATPKARLQLAGITALHIAAKYEEVWQPEVREYCALTARSCRRGEVLDMERSVLVALGFRLTVPTVHTFLHRFLKAAGAAGDRQVAEMAAYFAELALMECDMLRHAPSKVAAAAVHLALAARGLGSRARSAALGRHSGYGAAELRGCREGMLRLKEKYGKGELTAVHRKYARGTCLGVSKLPSPAI